MFKELEITNFRNVQNKKFNLSEKNIFVGKNGVGKTTIVDSILFLLADETLVNGREYSYDLNLNSLNTPVDVSITTDSGKKFRKVYFRYYKDDVYQENIMKYFVDDIELREYEYAKELNKYFQISKRPNIKGFNFMRAIIDPKYLSSIDYKIFRQFVDSLVSTNIIDDLLKEEKYSGIKKLIKSCKNDLEEAKKVVEEKEKECVHQIDLLEPQIKDEAQNFDKKAYDKLKRQRYNLLQSQFVYDKSIDELKAKLSSYSYELSVALKSKVSSYDSEKEKVKEDIKIQNEELEKLLKEKDDIVDEGTKYREYKDKENTIVQSNEMYIQVAKESITHIEREIERTKNDSFTFQKIICPFCHNVINNDEYFEKEGEFQKELQERYDNLLKEKKEKELDIKYYGELILKSNEKIRIYDDMIIGLRNTYQELKKKLENARIALDTSQKRLKELDELIVAKRDIKDMNIETLSNNIDVLNKKIAEKESADNIAKQKFEADKNKSIAELDKKIQVMEKAKLEHENYNKLTFRKEKMVKQNEIYETMISKIDELTSLYIEKVRSKTKVLFPNVDIEMLECSDMTNGYLKEVCYAKKGNVRFNSCNTASTVMMGIEIVESVKKKMGVKNVPIIFDILDNISIENMEEIFQRTQSQLFTTCVSSRSSDIELVDVNNISEIRREEEDKNLYKKEG